MPLHCTALHCTDRLIPVWRSYMSIDWQRMRSSPEDQMYDEQYQNNEDLVPTVTAEELNQLKKQHVLVRSIVLSIH